VLGHDGRRAAPRGALQRPLRQRAPAAAVEAGRLRQRRPLSDGDPGRAPLPVRVRGHARRPADVEAVERDLRHRTLEAGRPAVPLQQEVDRQRADPVGVRMSTDDLEPEPKSWNIWLTLMFISIAFMIVVAVLEYFGVFRDLGVILSAVGIVLAVGFG